MHAWCVCRGNRGCLPGLGVIGPLGGPGVGVRAWTVGRGSFDCLPGFSVIGPLLGYPCLRSCWRA